MAIIDQFFERRICISATVDVGNRPEISHLMALQCPLTSFLVLTSLIFRLDDTRLIASIKVQRMYNKLRIIVQSAVAAR